MSYSGLVQPTAMTSIEEVIDDTTPLINKVHSSDKAEALVTPVSLLEKVKTVDGLGSGLDADLLRGLPADFGSSLTDNGWQKLPSGLIIQWGFFDNFAQGTTNLVTLPVSFPTAGFVALSGRSGHNNTTTTLSEWGTYFASNSQIVVKQGTNGGTAEDDAGGYYFVIGY